MRLDHVSYVASHEQISDVVQRIGSLIGTAFVDGGVHPRFGTRNFTAPLVNGNYIEVVCPLDHPAADQTPFGQAVSRKAREGGGWLTWVFATNDIEPIESKIGREAVQGHRRLPNGIELVWKQIGIIEIMTEPVLPFFIEWISGTHPSKDGLPVSTLEKIEFCNMDPLDKSSFRKEILDALSSQRIDISVITDAHESSGISKISFNTPSGLVEID
jgi:hypothetical protein